MNQTNERENCVSIEAKVTWRLNCSLFYDMLPKHYMLLFRLFVFATFRNQDVKLHKVREQETRFRGNKR